MQVPVRRQPQTQPGPQQLAYQRPAENLDIAPLQHVMQGYRDQLLNEQEDRQRVDLNHRLLTEVNALQEDFAHRQTDPNVSPIDFADNTNKAYEERHQALIAQLRQEHFSNDLIDDFDTRLGAVRQGLLERGLVFQHTQLRARARQQLSDTATAASQYAALDPAHNYQSAVDTYENSRRSSVDLTEEERLAAGEQDRNIIREGALRSYAIQHPDEVVHFLDPQNLTAPGATTAPTTGAPTASATGWQGVATNVAQALQLDPVDVAAVMSYETAGSFSPTRMGGTGNRYMGLIQMGPEERAHYGINEHSTPEQWTQAILNYMHDRGFRPGMSLLDFYSTINAGRPGRYNASDGNGTVREHYERLVREHRGPAARWLAAATQTAAVDRAEAPITETSSLTSDITNVPIPASTAPMGQEQVAPDTQVHPTAAPDISSIRTGNALIDDLNGVQRIQLLSLAREQLNRRSVAQRAEMDVRINNYNAEVLQNGGVSAAPPPTDAEVLQAYGPVEGPQHIAQMHQSQHVGQATQQFRTQSATDIQHSLDAITPHPGSPSYATELEVFQHAQQAAHQILQQREQDPAGYVLQNFPEVQAAARRGTGPYYAALDRAYRQLGIDPATAPVMTHQAQEQLTEQYRGMTPSQRREFMRQNMSEMGEDRFRRFIHHMEGTTVEGDARIFALLRNYPGNGPTSALFHQVLEGRQTIEQDPARRPQAQAMTTMFRQVGGLRAIQNLNPEASRAIQEATEGLYVQRGGDPVTINQSVYQQALADVLGGSLPVDMRHGRVQDYTILPPRTNETQFRNWIERQTERSLQMATVGHNIPRYGDLRTPVPIHDIINEGVFVMTAPGYYMIKMGSDGRPLLNHQGDPIIVSIDPRNVIQGR